MRSQRLQELLPQLVTEPGEARSLEYKSALAWNEAKFIVARAALGLVNTRDGGFIVVGVKQEDDVLIPTGLTAEQEATFRADTVAEHISRYATERIEVQFDIVEETVAGQTMRFIVIEVSQFRRKPVFSKRASPDGTNPEGVIKVGVLYVRPYGGKPESRPATAEDHDEVIQMAVELQLRAFVETTKRAGIELHVAPPEPEATARYAAERGDL